MIRVQFRASSAIALVLCSVAAYGQQQSTETYEYDALGRVISAKTTGGINNNETHSICYDAAGNRLKYKTTTNGTVATCASQGTQGGTPTPSPSPSPSPTPGNSPPVTQSDFTSGQCFTTKTVNLTANDSDPEGNLPLSLTAITVNSGFGSPSIVSSTSVSVDFGPAGDVTVATYTVTDSLGATATGQLTISTSSCGGGIEP